MEMHESKPQPPVDMLPSARLLAIGLAVVTWVMRLIPHPWNFTPVGALCLYGGARLRAWQAFLIPFVALAASDFVIRIVRSDPGFDPFVYGSFLINILLGRWLLSGTESPWRIGSVCLLGSLQFYLITNFGSWLALSQPPHNTYSPTFDGLIASYIAGIPFARPTFQSDLLFCAVLFGLHALLIRRLSPAAQAQSVPSETGS